MSMYILTLSLLHFQDNTITSYILVWSIFQLIQPVPTVSKHRFTPLYLHCVFNHYMYHHLSRPIHNTHIHQYSNITNHRLHRIRQINQIITISLLILSRLLWLKGYYFRGNIITASLHTQLFDLSNPCTNTHHQHLHSIHT